MEEQFSEVVGNCHYEKLWNHLDRKELRDFGSTKYFSSDLKSCQLQLSSFDAPTLYAGESSLFSLHLAKEHCFVLKISIVKILF